MRKGLGLLTALVLVVALCGLSLALITGSKHDRKAVDGQICRPCHVPHKAGYAEFEQTLLWRQTIDSLTGWNSVQMWYGTWWTLGADQAGRTAGRCMSCHDGVYVVGPYGALTWETVSSAKQIALADSHPVGVRYDITMPSDFNSTPAAAIKLVPINSNTYVGCRSCHDPHNSQNVANFLVESNANSALCLECHIK